MSKKNGVVIKYKVLVAEDCAITYRLIEQQLGDNGVEVLKAITPIDLKMAVKNNPDIKVIILDACLDAREPDTIETLQEILESGFKGKIIASSSNQIYTEMLVKAGASHQANKIDAAKKALELLKIF